MRQLACLLGFLLLATLPASAAGVVDVKSNVKCDIYMDGEFVGKSPLTVSAIPGGRHEFAFVDPVTGKRQVFHFYVSKKVTVKKEISLSFQPGDPQEMILEPAGEPPRTGMAGQPPKAAVAKTRNPAPRRHNQQKVRIRNTSLGVGALGVITGSKTLTGLGLGGAVVNELVNK